MVKRARRKHPSHKFINEDILHHNPNTQYDNIISLYGPPTYIKNQENLIKKLLSLLKPEGQLFLMYYHDKYTPNYEQDLNIERSYVTEKILKKLYPDSFKIKGFQNIPKSLITYIPYTLKLEEYAHKLFPQNSDYLIIEGAK